MKRKTFMCFFMVLVLVLVSVQVVTIGCKKNKEVEEAVETEVETEQPVDSTKTAKFSGVTVNPTVISAGKTAIIEVRVSNPNDELLYVDAGIPTNGTISPSRRETKGNPVIFLFMANKELFTEEGTHTIMTSLALYSSESTGILDTYMVYIIVVVEENGTAKISVRYSRLPVPISWW